MYIDDLSARRRFSQKGKWEQDSKTCRLRIEGALLFYFLYGITTFNMRYERMYDCKTI
jgi:hypothetical protein